MKLTVGAKIVAYKYGKFGLPFEIERVTEKTAFARGMKFKIDVEENGYVRPIENISMFAVAYYTAQSKNL